MQHKASEIYIVKQRRGNYMNVFVSGKKKKKNTLNFYKGFCHHGQLRNNQGQLES